MEVYTIGFAKKRAVDFFVPLRNVGVQRLLDVRLNNTSQLARFTKKDDLPFLLREICGAEYVHEPLLAPTREILDTYRSGGGSWEEYEIHFLRLMEERRIEECLDHNLFRGRTALLCSEPTAERCHRRLVLEYLQARWGDIQVTHL